MADNTLQFETKVNLGGLNSGIDAAKASVSSFGNNIKSAMAAAADATKQLADAQIALGASAAAGNAQAAQVIAEYQQQVNAANAAVREFTATENQEADAVVRSTSARMAANAEIRIFEGNMQGSTRAAGAFLSQLPGIGAAMQAAFPIFGAVAVAEILVQVASKVHDVYNEYVNLYSLQQSVISHVLTDENEEISLSNQRLAQLREQQVLAAEMTGGKKGRSDRGAAAGDKFDQTQDKLDLQNAQDLLRATNEVITAKEKASKPFAVPGWFGPLTVDTLEMRQQAALLPQLREDAQKYSDQVDTIQQKLSVDKTKTTLRTREAGEKENGDPNQKMLQSMENAYNEEVLNGNKTLAFEYQFWSTRLSLFNSSSEQYKAILEKMATSAQQSAQKAHTAIELFRAGESVAAMDTFTGAKKPVEDDLTKLIKQGNEAIEKMKQAESEAKAQSAHDSFSNTTGVQETKVQAGMALGITDPTKDLEALKTLHAQAIAEDERFIQQEIGIYAQEPAKVEQLQKQLDQVIQKGNEQQLNDTTKILQQQEQKYKTAYTEITQDFNSAINKMITTTEGPAKAFAQMLNQMIGQLASFIEQYLEKKAEMWVLDQVLTKSSQTAQATAQVTSNAAVAASGAIAATSAIPVVGPALAPAAGAAAFSEAISFLGLAAFESGGIVNGSHGMPVPIMAHAGERVLSAPQTQKFESMVNQGGSNSSSSHLTYAPNINAYDKTGMKSILQSHASDIHAIVRSGLKSGSLGRP